ncbi:MAG TPA: flagellar biosynthesis protein FlhB [bacterium]|nr:flagellar biosynthesis protein FlhB [bacterium]
MADPSKSEAATPKRKEEARNRGQVARSTELSSALSLLGILVVLNLSGGYMLTELTKIARYTWGGLGTFTFSDTDLRRQSLTFFLELLLVLGPMLLGAVVIGVTVNVMQFGFLFAPEAMQLKFENLSPARGFQRVFSRRTAVEIFKSFLKIGTIGVISWMTIAGKVPELMNLMNTDLVVFFTMVGATASAVMLRVGLAMLGWALLDFFYQRWEFDESLKMSKQEVKDEHRQMEGDPLVKARIRRLQQAAARRRMFADLPNADVVITNPTHLAVALKYDGTTMDAPKVLAKGARLMAARIKAIAAEHNIPVMENKPLAQALYRSVPVGGSVPGAFFNAVAEVLAFVYQAKGTLADKARQNQERIARKAWTGRLDEGQADLRP